MIGDHDFSAMCIHNRFAQCQAQPHAAAAIRNLIGRTVKHIENMRFVFVGDSRTVICNRDIDIASFLFPANVDFRSRRCILDGIVNNVNPLLRIKQQFAQAAMRQRGIVSEDAGILPRSDKARAAYYLTAKTKDPGELKVNLWGKSSVILAMQASKSPAGPASVRWVC